MTSEAKFYDLDVIEVSLRFNTPKNVLDIWPQMTSEAKNVETQNNEELNIFVFRAKKWKQIM